MQRSSWAVHRAQRVRRILMSNHKRIVQQHYPFFRVIPPPMCWCGLTCIAYKYSKFPRATIPEKKEKVNQMWYHEHLLSLSRQHTLPVHVRPARLLTSDSKSLLRWCCCILEPKKEKQIWTYTKRTVSFIKILKNLSNYILYIYIYYYTLQP